MTLDSSVLSGSSQLFMLWRLQGTYLAQVALFGSNGSCLAPNPVRRFAHFIFACFRMDCNCFKSHKGTFIKSFSWSTFHDTFHQQLLWVDLIISVGVLGPVTMEPEFSLVHFVFKSFDRSSCSCGKPLFVRQTIFFLSSLKTFWEILPRFNTLIFWTVLLLSYL